MKYSVIYEPKDDIITATVHGDANLGGFSKMFAEIVECIKRTNCYCLINDMRTASLKMTLMEVSALPGMFQAAAIHSDVELKDLKRALVSDRRPEMLEMQEILNLYIGSTFKYFQTIEEAKNWLAEAHDPIQA